MDEPDLFGDLTPGPQVFGNTTPGRGRRSTRLDAAVWRTLLACQDTAAAYAAATYRRGDADCWYWVGALSDSGHGKLKAGRGAGATAGRTVTAHVYGYQLHRQRLITPTPSVPDPVVGHLCDESSCQNPRHWDLISRGANVRAFHQRKHRFPLNDVRTPPGHKSARAAALRKAIRQAQEAQRRVRDLWEQGREVPPALALEADVEAALHRASEAGRPPEAFETFALF